MGTKALQQTESTSLIARLLSAENDIARRDSVQHNLAADWDQVVSDLADRVRHEVHVSTVEAHRLADIAILVAEIGGTQVSLAKSRRAKANALYATDEHAA